MSSTNLRDFLEIPYDELERLNLEAKEKVIKRTPEDQLEKHYLSYLEGEPRIKAVTICFSDLEGRLHMLDYDKKFLLKSHDNLTFDGSSIRGFSRVRESDLRLKADWGSFRWMPSDVFGPGKVLVFASIFDRDGAVYGSDLRGVLKSYTQNMLEQKSLTANISVECEGFLFEGINAEQNYSREKGFTFVSSGGYYNSLPKEPLRLFIDAFAEAQRAMGFENEKDHPEVAPSQFELNFTYAPALVAADQVQVYKLLARQIAANMGMTASFLPKPVAGINGSGMHTNVSISKDGKNLFHDAQGKDGLSDTGWNFVDRVLSSASDILLTLGASVNAYRRLDPNYEAPNQIRSSANDRTSMIRIPLANEKSARIEVRVVAPDSNPYLAFLSILKTGLEGPLDASVSGENRGSSQKSLSANIHDAIEHFEQSSWITEMIGEENKAKYIECKTSACDRCPKELGSQIKSGEILYHHEVTNQSLWQKY
jgi:glutamine synthetase